MVIYAYFSFITLLFLPLDAINVDERLENLEKMFHNLLQEKNDKIAQLENRVKLLELTMQTTMIENNQNNVITNANPTETKRGDLFGTEAVHGESKNNTIPSAFLKRQLNEVKVAFHAVQSSSRSYGIHEIIKFNQIEINVGNGYHTSGDYTFDAPVSGVYVFTCTVVPEFYEYVQLELMVSGNVKGSGFADSDEIHDIHPSTFIVVTRVNKGEHVFIRKGKTGNSHLRSSPEVSPSFSGWLLFQ